MDVNRFARKLTLKKHFFKPPIDEVSSSGSSLELGELVSSPILFKDVCGLQDLTDLLIESDPCPVDPVDDLISIPFKLQSRFYPLGSRGSELDLYQKLVERDLTHLAHSCLNVPHSSNLTQLEKKALMSLSSDKDVMIRNADKGGGGGCHGLLPL